MFYVHVQHVMRIQIVSSKYMKRECCSAGGHVVCIHSGSWEWPFSFLVDESFDKCAFKLFVGPMDWEWNQRG